jgi:alpha-1,2-rhamnosyltransferase
MARTTLCYIDCTDTFNFGHNAGIHRVVKNIITRLEVNNQFRGYKFVPVISIGSNLYELSTNSHQYFAVRSANKLIGILRNTVDRLFAKNKEVLKESYNSDPMSLKKKKSKTIMHLFHSNIISFCRRLIPYLINIFMLLDTILTKTQKITIHPGDMFLIADSFWNINTYSVAQKAKIVNAKIILLIYDLIPITHPTLMDAAICSNFEEYLPKYLDIVDGIIAISNTTMQEVIRYCASLDNKRSIALDYFYLGADFQYFAKETEVTELLKRALCNGKYYLMVGTIEPRKNHLYVIDAFEYLWDKGYDIKLCIVGGIGWKCADIIKKITDSRFKKNILFYEKLNDTDLSYCYRNSTAVIISSIVEGFGLPLIEAMYFNKIVLASDIPVFREIGKCSPVYFSLDDNLSLIQMILQVENGEILPNKNNKIWFTWDDSTKDLLEKVIRLAGMST